MQPDFHPEFSQAVNRLGQNQQEIENGLHDDQAERIGIPLHHGDDDKRLCQHLKDRNQLQVNKALIRDNHSVENFRGNGDDDVDQQDDKNLLGTVQLRRCEGILKNPAQIDITDSADNQHQQGDNEINQRRKRQDILHALPVIQSLIFGKIADNRRRQAKIHHRKIGDKGAHQLIKAVFLLSHKLQQQRHIDETDYRIGDQGYIGQNHSDFPLIRIRFIHRNSP